MTQTPHGVTGMHMTTIEAQKSLLRLKYKTIRQQISHIQANTTSDKIANYFLDHFSQLLHKNSVIAAYYPINHELDTLPLVAILRDLNCKIALPQTNHDHILIFREWRYDDKLLKPDNKCFEPDGLAIVLEPNIIIVPMLAGDRHGNRLGYGQGNYDRAIAHHRQQDDNVMVIGVCYEAQISDEDLPTTMHDQKMDYIITEGGVITACPIPVMTQSAPDIDRDCRKYKHQSLAHSHRPQ